MFIAIASAPDPGETHAVDQSAIVGKSKDARFRVAGLRIRSDRADFDEVPAERVQGREGDSVLVEPGGDPDWAGQSYAGDSTASRESYPVRRTGPGREAPSAIADQTEGGNDAVVDRFGISPEEQRFGGAVGEVDHAVTIPRRDWRYGMTVTAVPISVQL